MPSLHNRIQKFEEYGTVSPPLSNPGGLTLCYSTEKYVYPFWERSFPMGLGQHFANRAVAWFLVTLERPDFSLFFR